LAKRIKLAHGDVFTFPLSDGLLGFGQIFGSEMVFHASLFGHVASDSAEVDTALAGPIEVCGWTTDGAFYRNEWNMIGNKPVDEDKIPKPLSKVVIGGAGDIWVNDWLGKPIRRATPGEAQFLDNHLSASPTLLVAALKHVLGIEPWPYVAGFEKYTAAYRQKMADRLRI
jgi:hypothetical protein